LLQGSGDIRHMHVFRVKIIQAGQTPANPSKMPGFGAFCKGEGAYIFMLRVSFYLP
jgi:hypothetical protein